MEAENEVIEEEVAEDTLAASLEAAWDASEGGETAETAPEPVETAPEPEETPELSAEATETPAETPETGDQAPVGLPPAAREAWKDTPKAMKEAIAKREADFASGIQKYAESAKRAEMMDKSLQPFQQYFAMNGNQPGQTIAQLLQTASLLQMGTPQQKAEMVASLIGQFGVDIPALDGLLSGNGAPEAVQQQSHLQQELQQQLAPIQQFMAQQQHHQQYQQHQMSQNIDAELQLFANDPAHEFYADVREDMADILDMAGRRGVEMDLKTAYERACAMRPDIKNILDARVSQSDVNSRRRAASSVSGAPAGSSVPQAAGSMRGALEAAWEAAENPNAI
jgi:hypothetical protein